MTSGQYLSLTRRRRLRQPAAWSRVIAPVAAIAHLTYDGPEPVIDELIVLPG
ncbi:hypothetical protein [Streptomyces viridochromogenes]|uniref:hypothetical protein n=1 Tax=Streptomyces viridochromogenes TaxID=1938 RepID=UPI001FCAEE30|nr:hypothetical protein [Streptomyces viridochromogenes]